MVQEKAAHEAVVPLVLLMMEASCFETLGEQKLQNAALVPKECSHLVEQHKILGLLGVAVVGLKAVKWVDGTEVAEAPQTGWKPKEHLLENSKVQS